MPPVGLFSAAMFTADAFQCPLKRYHLHMVDKTNKSDFFRVRYVAIRYYPVLCYYIRNYLSQIPVSCSLASLTSGVPQSRLSAVNPGS